MSEGAGGLLTVLNTEESPLSTTQVVRFTPEIRESRQCSRNELLRVCAMIPKGRGRPHADGTNTPTLEQVQTVPSTCVAEGRVGC